MNKNAFDMIEFARRWLPYGGGPDDEVLVTFGVPVHRFYQRLAQILDTGDSMLDDRLTAREALGLRKLCMNAGRRHPRNAGHRPR